MAVIFVVVVASVGVGVVGVTGVGVGRAFKLALVSVVVDLDVVVVVVVLVAVVVAVAAVVVVVVVVVCISQSVCPVTHVLHVSSSLGQVLYRRQAEEGVWKVNQLQPVLFLHKLRQLLWLDTLSKWYTLPTH